MEESLKIRKTLLLRQRMLCADALGDLVPEHIKRAIIEAPAPGITEVDVESLLELENQKLREIILAAEKSLNALQEENEKLWELIHHLERNIQKIVDKHTDNDTV